MLKLNLGAGDRPLDGFVNLDLPEWRYQDGLPEYEDATVDAVTISHSLMYVPLDDWPDVFCELARVVKPGGVVRATEDDTGNPESERFGGYPDAVTLTSPRMLCDFLNAAGFSALSVDPEVSFFADGSLIQNGHGRPPKVFHVEGVRQEAGE